MLACPRAISETAQIISPAPRCGQDIGWAKAHRAVPTIHAVLSMVGTLPPSLVELRRTCALCPPYEFGVLGRQNGRHATTIPRRNRARVMQIAAPQIRRGRRECRVMASPMARLQTKKAGGSDHRLSRINRHSLRWCYGLYAPSPVSGLDSHRRLSRSWQGLIPASGDQHHATSPSASATIVSRSLRVHRIPAPRFVTIGRNVPLHRGGMRETLLVICPTGQA
jgi:hypothetical protein